MQNYSLVVLILLGVLGTAARGEEPKIDLARLGQQNRDAARKTYETTWANYRDGRAPADLLYRWSKRWLRAEKQISDRPADQIAACKAHLERMQELERLLRALQSSRQVTADEVSAAEFYRTEAELWLVEAQKAKGDR